jgi:hypothetical protein
VKVSFGNWKLLDVGFDFRRRAFVDIVDILLLARQHFVHDVHPLPIWLHKNPHMSRPVSEAAHSRPDEIRDGPLGRGLVVPHQRPDLAEV